MGVSALQGQSFPTGGIGTPMLGVDANGNLQPFPLNLMPQLLTLSAGGVTAAEALQFGATSTEGLGFWVIDETVTLTNAVLTNLTNTVPSGALILSVQANLQTAITGDGSGDDGLAGVSVGISGTVSKYGFTAALTKNQKISTIPSAYAVLGSTQIGVYASNGSGVACTEKFTAGGKVRVRIVYLAATSLNDV